MLLKKLTEASGVSGNENEIRSLIIDEIKDYVDSIEVDRLGNIIAFKKGKSKLKETIMLAAHMDEVGFIVEEIDDMGLLKFLAVGGIDKRVLVSKVVLIGENKIPGVIGAKPIHLQKPEERKNSLNMEELYIDFGAKSKEDAEKYVQVGDYVSFYSEYEEFGRNKVKAKALDDRVGCGILIELLKNFDDFDFYGVFTVMEEVGLKGAGPASYRVEPDYSIILEGTICADGNGVDGHLKTTELGQGPAISLMDRTTIYDQDFREYVEEMARENKIKYQYRKSSGGGNDSGVIHLSKKGSKTCGISVACRYIHSNVSVMDKDDYKNAYRLAYASLEGLSKYLGGNSDGI